MGAFFNKKLTHNMGPFVRKFPCITYNEAFCSLKFCLYIFFFQTYLNSSSFFFFFFLLLFFSFLLFFFLNFPGGGRRPTLAPPLPPLATPLIAMHDKSASTVSYLNEITRPANITTEAAKYPILLVDLIQYYNYCKMIR